MRIDWPYTIALCHVTDLADKHDIMLVWDDKPAHALIPYRTIHTPRPRTPAAYLGALHEMGHVVSPQAVKFYKRWDRRKPHYSPTSYDDLLLMEAAAWAWAASNLHPDLPISKKAWMAVASDLVTYLQATAEQ